MNYSSFPLLQRSDTLCFPYSFLLSTVSSLRKYFGLFWNGFSEIVDKAYNIQALCYLRFSVNFSSRLFHSHSPQLLLSEPLSKSANLLSAMLSCTTVGLSARHPTYFVFWTLMLQLSFFEVQMVEDKSHQRVNSPHSEDDLCLLWHINLSASTCSYGIRIQLLRQLALMCLLCAFMHFDPMMLQRVFKLLGVATSAILLRVTFIGPQNNP